MLKQRINLVPGVGSRWMTFTACVLSGLVLSIGCQKQQPAPAKPESAEKATSQATDTQAAEKPEPPSTRPRGVDKQDAPDAPRALPRTAELDTWIKTKPVQPAKLEKLKALIEAKEHRDLVDTFRIDRLAECTYTTTDSSNTADVLFVEAKTPMDAFGIFSILTDQPGQFVSEDGSVRIENLSSAEPTMSAWQGNVYVLLKFAECKSEQDRAFCQRIFDRIIFNLPAADAPLLMRVIPKDKRQDCKVWVARSTGALRGATEKILQTINYDAMDARLGLTGDALLTVAAVQVAEDEPPNLIWLVEYPKPANADAAHQRYSKALQAPAGRLDTNTIMDKARGRHLAGSWSADQESLQHLLEPLAEVLSQ